MDPQSKPILEVAGLRVKRSSEFELVIDDFHMVRKDFICLVGPNGSGKTTLLESLIGLIENKDSKIVVCDHGQNDIEGFKKNIGYIPDDDGWIIAELTAREYFKMLISIYKKAGINRDMANSVIKLAKYLFFENFDQQLGSLSHGNRKKVQIIAGLLHSPPLLIIDELRNGLDPIVIRRAESLIKKANQTGVTVLAATHDLWWAERMADQVAMMRGGRIILQDKVQRILAGSNTLEDKFLNVYQMAN